MSVPARLLAGHGGQASTAARRDQSRSGQDLRGVNSSSPLSPPARLAPQTRAAQSSLSCFVLPKMLPGNALPRTQMSPKWNQLG